MLYEKLNIKGRRINMTMKDYDVMEDIEFRKAIGTNLSKESVKSYSQSIMMFCKVNQKTFAEMVTEIKTEQYDRIEDNKVIRYDPNQGNVNHYLNNFVKYYQDNNFSIATINSRVGHARTMLKRAGIILPERQKLMVKNQEKPRIISRNEISQILNYCDIWQKSYVTFLASVGMRAQDFVNLTIDDFIDATFDYHNCIDVDDFIDHAPKDMMGYWVFIPQKTQRLGLECRVCNTPESSNILMETLRIRKEKLAEKGKRLKGEDPLFISQNNGYNSKILKKSLTATFWRINQKLQKEVKKDLDLQLKNREISRKEYRKRMNNLPRLHPHGLRKFFTTTVRNYTTNRDISLIMEGHTSPFAMDKHYVGVNDELFSDEKIKETYETVIPYLTFQQKIDSEEYYKLKNVEKKYLEQVEINKDLSDKIKIIERLMKEKSIIDKLGIE